MTQFEIEQKFSVPDLENCRNRILNLFEVDGQSEVHQTDQYLFHPVRDFAVTDEAFRIRTIQVAGQEDRICLTYKGPRIKSLTTSDDFKTRREIEVPFISHLESETKLHELFSVLGFQPATVVEKHRERLQVTLHEWDVEFALDEVEGLGAFLEVEVVTSEEHIAAAQEILAAIAQQLGLSDAITDSYLEMLTNSPAKLASNRD